MRITHVDVQIRRQPASPTPKRDALQSLPGSGSVRVEVTTDTGITGLGEAGFGRIAGGPDALASLIEHELKPLLMGQDPAFVRGLHQVMLAETEYHGSQGLAMFGIAALDTAIWDCLGKGLGVPCWQLWGGVHSRIPAYAMVGWLNYDNEEVQVICRQAVAQGFRAVKIKVGYPTLAEDVQRVAVVRKAVGENIGIMVDANQALTTAEAVRRGRAFEEMGCLWWEEPIPADDIDGYAELARALDIPIATGENLYTAADFARFLRRDAVDIVQPDLRRAGGPTALLQIGTMAAAFRRPYASHGGGPVQLNIMACLSNLPTAQEAKLIGMELLRLGLERGQSAAEAVEVITGLVSRYGQGKFANDAGVRTYDNGYIVADPQEAFVVETAGHEWAVRRVKQAVGISNVYSIGTDWETKSPAAPTDFVAGYADPTSLQGSGAVRRARSCALLARPSQPLAVPDFMAILSDHGGSTSALPAAPSICMHSLPDGSRGNTAASLVADLCADGSRLPVYWCSFYSPCLGLFLPIFLEGELPPVLSLGGQTPSVESPWWGFYRLNQLARREPENRLDWVRNHWMPLQASLLASAYPLAQKAKKLIDSGGEAAARGLLSDYMAENTQQMLGQLRRMLAELEEMESRLPARKEPALAATG